MGLRRDAAGKRGEARKAEAQSRGEGRDEVGGEDRSQTPMQDLAGDIKDARRTLASVELEATEMI